MSDNTGDLTPQILYNDRLDQDDQITLEEEVAAIIHGSLAEGGASEEAAAELGRRVVQAVLARARPDLFDAEDLKDITPLRVHDDGARTAVVALQFSENPHDDRRLAENIVRALAAECRSGNGLADEACEGHTQTITVHLNDACHMERP